MPEFIYTTSLVIVKPVLIDAEKLESLDRLLDEEWQRLTQRNQERLNKEVEKTLLEERYVSSVQHVGEMFRMDVKRKRIIHDFNNEEEAPLYDDDALEAQVAERMNIEQQRLREQIRTNLLSSSYHGFTENRSITIYLGQIKKVIVNSFDEAFRQQELLDEKPRRFDIELNSGDIKCALSLRRDGSLEISVSPEHLSESRELFAALQRWSTSIRPPIWQEIWANFYALLWFLWSVTILISIFTIGDLNDAANRAFKAQANELLKDGLSQEEQLRAIETLLALNSGYIPQNLKASIPLWFWLLLIGGFLVCLALSFSPKSLIGIGKGEQAIMRWRMWMRFVAIGVPVYILSNLVLPFITKLLGLQ